MDSQVEEIKARLNIAEIIGQYVKLDRAGRSLRARCPFHKEKTPSFFVSPERGTYICFGCGEKGDVFSFVQKMEGIDFPEALAQLAERAGVKLERRVTQTPAEKDAHERLFMACEEATTYFEGQLKERPKILEYLHSRAVTDQTIETWRIGYAPASWEDLSKHLVAKGYTKNEIVEAGLAARSEKKPGEVYDRFRGRVMFPIFDAGGKTIAFSGRFFEKVPGTHEEGEPAKYVNSPETALFKKSRTLYGYDRARHAIRKADCVLLVEGQFDLIMCHQSGLPFTVAASGTALTPEHLTLLGKLSKRLVLALDNDEAGLRAGLRSALMALQLGFDVKVPSFVDAKDPADIARENPEALKDAIRKSKTAVEFFLEALRPGAHDERGYKKIVEAQVLPLVAAIESRIDQAHFVSLVAGRLGVPESAVQAEVLKVQKGKPATEQSKESSAPTTAFAQDDATPHERAAAMILFHSKPTSPEMGRVEELLGKEKTKAIQEKLAQRAEALRFMFDASGTDEAATIAGLLHTIERGVVEEGLHILQWRLRSGEGNNPTLLKELADLKRKQEALRK